MTDETFKCARKQCHVLITEKTGLRHKHIPMFYCRGCAILINKACRDAPPFDLGGES